MSLAELPQGSAQDCCLTAQYRLSQTLVTQGWDSAGRRRGWAGLMVVLGVK